MRRTATFVVFGVGVLVLAAGIIKILPGGIGTGAALMFWGVLMFALSFIKRPEVEADAPPALSPFERILGMFYMPGTVFRSLRRHPSWLVPLLIVTLLSSVYMFAFVKRLTPERVAHQMTIKATEGMVEAGWMPAAAAQQQKEAKLRELQSRVSQIESLFTGLVFAFAMTALSAAVLLLLVLIFGGRINYWQAFAAVAYAAVPAVVITKVLSFILLYIKDPADIHPMLGQETLVTDNLGILFSPAQHPVLFVWASFIGVISIYRIWLLATGLRLTGEKVSPTAAWGATITITIIIMLFVTVSVLFAPGAIS